MENSELIEKALRYIKSECERTDISVEDVAEHAGFSTNYFNHIFAAHTGFNVMEYVRFTRLRKASLQLRVTEDSILDIALKSGYDSHESFSRAFKNQYGQTPTDYREEMKKIELLYSEFNNETVGVKLLHEFKELKQAQHDDVIDFLLEKDAIKYGYTAICFNVNGGAALYLGEKFEDGFVWVSQWDNKFEVEIIADDYDTIASYCKLFHDDRFKILLYTIDREDEILSELNKRGVKYVRADGAYIAVYRGEKYEIAFPQNITMRELTFADYELIEKYYAETEGSLSTRRKAVLAHLNRVLWAKYEGGNTEHSVYVFGMFKEEKLIALSFGGLQRVHGFVINNCIETSILKKYENDELYKFAFKYITNAAMDAGALPIDDIQNINNDRKSGNFNSTDLGYEIVQYRYVLS